ncbi:MAG: response regulator [Verrucomicrobiota bacterium]
MTPNAQRLPTTKRKLNTLIIEDNDDDALILEKHLNQIENFDFEINHATDLHNGVTFFSRGRFDLIFTDLKLPDSDGLMTVEKICRSCNQDSLLIVTSGVLDDKDTLNILQQGADYCIPKNRLDKHKLEKFIQRTLEQENIADLYNNEIEDAFSGQPNFQALVNSSPDPILVVDDKNIIRFINPSGVYLFQKDPYELVGSEFNLPTTRGFSEVEISRPDSPNTIVELQVVGINWKKTHAYLVTLRDITQRKRMEARLQDNERRLDLYLQCGDLAVWDWDLVSNKYTYSQQFMFMLGYSREEFESIASENLDKLIHPDDLDKMKQSLVNCIKQRALVYESEHRVLTKSGKWHWVLERGKIVDVNAHGHPCKFMGICQDITKLKELEEENFKSSKLDALGLLAGGIAHDLNNILMAIDLNLESAMDDFPVPLLAERKQRLTESQKASGRAKELAKRLIAFSKGGVSQLQVVHPDVVLKDTVQFVVRGSQIKPVYQIEENIPPVYVDTSQFQQVIDNLVINARDACPQGGKLTIRGRSVELQDNQIGRLKAGTYVQIDFMDQGCGIAEEHLSKIFDPYFTTKSHGNGIGLSTCYAIMAKHSGAILVESALHVGTTFSLYLPVTRKPLAASVSQEKRVQTAHANILIIDDEQVICSGLKRSLERKGYLVTTSANGDDGIKKYQQQLQQANPFQVVLLDGIIPDGLSGEEALKRLLQIDASAKVILFSGYSEKDLTYCWKDCGFVEQLTKPCSVEEIISKVQKVLT